MKNLKVKFHFFLGLISLLFLLTFSSCQKISPVDDLEDENLEFRACAVTIDNLEYLGNCQYRVPGFVPIPNEPCPNIRIIVEHDGLVIEDEIVDHNGLVFTVQNSCTGSSAYKITLDWDVPGNHGCRCSGSRTFNLPGCAPPNPIGIQAFAGQDSNCNYYLYATASSNIYLTGAYMWAWRRGSNWGYAYNWTPSPNKLFLLDPKPDEICYYRLGTNGPNGTCYMYYDCTTYQANINCP